MEHSVRGSYWQKAVHKPARGVCFFTSGFFILLVFFGTPSFSQGGLWQIRDIVFSGNRITRSHILEREIGLSIGDTMSFTQIEEAMEGGRQNLLNTGLFNFVEGEIIVQDSIHRQLLLHYSFTERWYLWPLPVFDIADRNINAWWESGALRRANYGFLLSHHNMRGRKEKLTAAFLTGHEKLFSLVYDIPYLDRVQRWGGWAGFSYATTRELLLNELQSRPVWYASSDLVLQQRLSLGLGAHFRLGLHHRFQFNSVYEQISLHDSVLLYNPDFPYITGKTESERFSLKLFYQWDRRDQRYYPLEGHYLDVNLDWHFIPSGRGNTVVCLQSLLLNARRYLPLSSRWYAAGGWVGFLSLPGSSPFIFHHGLGFDRKFVRGYEDYLFQGEAYALTKAELKWALMPQREVQLPFIPYSQFNRLHLALFLTAFADVGRIHSRSADGIGGLDEKWLRGYGLGLNLVTYYDKVLRVEYSKNGRGEGGVFVHAIAPI